MSIKMKPLKQHEV